MIGGMSDEQRTRRETREWARLVLRHPAAELSDTAKVIACAIAERATSVTRADHDVERVPASVAIGSFACWSSWEEIASWCGLRDPRTIRRSVTALRAHGWLVVVERRGLSNVLVLGRWGKPFRARRGAA